MRKGESGIPDSLALASPLSWDELRSNVEVKYPAQNRAEAQINGPAANTHTDIRFFGQSSAACQNKSNTSTQHNTAFNSSFSVKPSESSAQCSGKVAGSSTSSTGAKNAASHPISNTKAPDVLLYREAHFWCPFCLKVQMFLEAKRIPYRIKRINSYGYGEKDMAYRKLVRNGKLPAVSFDSQRGKIYDDADSILTELENQYGPLGCESVNSRISIVHRQRERKLFNAWSSWMLAPKCNSINGFMPAGKLIHHSGHHDTSSADLKKRNSKMNDHQVIPKISQNNECHSRNDDDVHSLSISAKNSFIQQLNDFDTNWQSPYILGSEMSVIDIIYIVSLERMLASVFFYKGYNMIEKHPVFARWFSTMQTRVDCYQGLMSDFQTHVRSVPARMGTFCFADSIDVQRNVALVVGGLHAQGSLIGIQVDPASYPEPADSRYEAIFRVVKHHTTLEKVSPYGAAPVDFGLRVVLTQMLAATTPPTPLSPCSDSSALTPAIRGASNSTKDDDDRGAPPHIAAALRHIKERVAVPRDMPIWSAIRFRDALEVVAVCYCSGQRKKTSSESPKKNGL